MVLAQLRRWVSGVAAWILPFLGLEWQRLLVAGGRQTFRVSVEFSVFACHVRTTPS